MIISNALFVAVDALAQSEDQWQRMEKKVKDAVAVAMETADEEPADVDMPLDLDDDTVET